MSTDPTSGGRPPSDVLLSVAESATELVYVAFRQKAWEQALKSPIDLSDRGAEKFLDLGAKVGETIATGDQHVSSIRDFLASNREWADEHLSVALTSSDLPGRQRETLERLLNTEGTYVERGIALADSLMLQMPETGTSLQAKVTEFRKANSGARAFTVSEDFAVPPGGCEVLALATMASLLLCPETGISCVGAFIGGAALVHYCS